MSTVSVSELKARLSAYLREVRQGGEVQVLDRGKPVARLVPMSAEVLADQAADKRRRERLIASGVLRPGTGIDLTVRSLPVSIELGRGLEEERDDRL